MGVAGLVTFLLGWIFILVAKLIRSKDFLGLAILMTLAAAMFTEVYFDRSLGGLLVGFFISFLMTPFINERK